MKMSGDFLFGQRDLFGDLSLGESRAEKSEAPEVERGVGGQGHLFPFRVGERNLPLFPEDRGYGVGGDAGDQYRGSRR